MTNAYVNPELLEDYKQYPGPPEHYYAIFQCVSKMLFNEGLKEDTRFLEIGCGPLRMARFFIPFLLPDCYHGLEPEKEMVQIALEKEIFKPFGYRVFDHKRPKFDYNPDFNLSAFGDTMFDMVIAEQVFIHCGKRQFIQCLKSVRDRLKPSGRFITHMNIADYSGSTPKSEETRWAYRYASHAGTCYTESDFRELVEKHGYYCRRVDRLHFCLTLKPPIKYM